MIGETFRDHFLFFRAVTLVVASVGLWGVFRRRSPALAFLTLAGLGIVSWLYTVSPLTRLYGLRVGSEATFEVALASGGAVRGASVESWVVDRRDPRPLLGLFWHAVAGGRAERVPELYQWLGLAVILWLLAAVYVSIRTSGLDADGDGRWLALCCSFTAVFAATVALDAFRPFGPFHRMFFVTPHRPLALGIALLLLSLAWRRRRWSPVAGIGLGLVGWIDLNVLAWGVASLVVLDMVATFRERRFAGLGGLVAAALATLVAWPQCAAFARSTLLVRGLSTTDVDEYAIAFRDLGSATTDMSWIFFLAVAAVILLWKQGRAPGLGLVSLLLGAYAIWAAHSVGFFRGRILEPDEAYQILRFSTAVLAGVAAHRMGVWIGDHRERFFAPAGPFERWFKDLPPGLPSFVLIVVALGATGSPILWHPLRMDPDYYPSLQYPISESDRRLARWVRRETSADEVVLSGPVTSEWIAALSGRRVRNGVFVLPRDERRRLRRDTDAIFLSRDPAAMRAALSRVGATVLVVDDSFREVYWRMWKEEPTRLETSGVFRMVKRIGDDYVVYRAR